MYHNLYLDIYHFLIIENKYSKYIFSVYIYIWIIFKSI
jgi:hypothetical protein